MIAGCAAAGVARVDLVDPLVALLRVILVVADGAARRRGDLDDT
jgi:hypothetical protein